MFCRDKEVDVEALCDRADWRFLFHQKGPFVVPYEELIGADELTHPQLISFVFPAGDWVQRAMVYMALRAPFIGCSDLFCESRTGSEWLLQFS